MDVLNAWPYWSRDPTMTAVKLNVRHTCSTKSRVPAYRPRRRTPGAWPNAAATPNSAASVRFFLLRNCSR